MNKLFVLVGIPASGKSTYAKEKLKNEDTIILSSDALRKELLGDESCQTNNELVFSTLYKRAKEYLNNGKNVVIDATNINMKDRRRTLSNFQGMNIERIAIVFATPFDVCYERDSKRERNVGKEVINKFLYRFEIPMEYEGFDNVKIIESEHKHDIDKTEFIMNGFDQKNPHHLHTVGKHCELCYKYLGNKTNYNHLLSASRWHDIGKVFTQTFDENGIAHYYSHHNFGAYVLLCNNYKFNRETIFYVNFHMNPFFWKDEKTHEKYKKLFGEERYKNLMLLNECDKLASGTQKSYNGL